VSSDAESHSIWCENISTSVQVWSLFSVFVFTTITMFLTLFSDPSKIPIQISLFLLGVIFDLLLFVIYSYQNALNHCVRVAPPLPRKMLRVRYDVLDNLVYVLLGTTLLSMLLIWNLFHLALAVGIIHSFFLTLGYKAVYEPTKKTEQKYEAETGKSWRIRKFCHDRDSVVESEEGTHA
jgi:hypothetical protein